MPNIVKRHQYADYLNIGSSDSPNWVLMGTGFTTLDESPGAQTETSKYVNEVTSSTEVVSYESTFDFEADQVISEDAVNAIYEVGRNHKVGQDAEFEYVRVELWDPDASGNEYAARKFDVAVEVSTISGENKQIIDGTLHAIGDPVLGTFNTANKSFTEAESG
ncbi:MAG: hypothetical protein LUD72_10390 [Bacteroidales bacterium]|nr:hypothetical protein [Bacteroidales bacterium]